MLLNRRMEIDQKRRGVKMGNYERNFIEKMREEIEISDLVNDKLEESYGKIRQ